MPSSPVPAARCHYLLDLLAQVPDPRKRRGRLDALAGLLAVGIAAVIAGSRSFAAIGQWAADAGEDVLAVLGADRGPAEESTFRRAFALLDPGLLDQVLGAWLWTRAVQVGGRLGIAIDGKAVRGAKNKDGKAPHLVAALAHGIGAVLGQAAVDAKSNEIPAVRDLLKAFVSLAGAVITIDALHTQSDTAQVILGRDADYVMTVKGNMPTLYRQLKKLPWARIPATSSVSKGHGRRARRTIKVALAPAWIGFAGAAQVAQLRRTVTKKGTKTVEVVYLITSDRAAGGCPGRRGPRALAHREQAPLGPRRHLSGGQVPGQNRKRTPRDGNAAQPGHQHPAAGRPRQHRRRQPPPRPRPAAHTKAASGCMTTTLPGPWVSGGQIALLPSAEAGSNRLLSAALSPDGTLAVTGSQFGTVTIWNAPDSDSGMWDWKQMNVISMPEGDAVDGMAFSSDGKLLATANQSGGAYVWQFPSGLPEGESVSAVGRPLNSVMFDPVNSNLVVTADDDGYARIFNVSTDKQVGRSFGGGGSAMYAAAFSLSLDDGKRIVTASGDRCPGLERIGSEADRPRLRLRLPDLQRRVQPRRN